MKNQFKRLTVNIIIAGLISLASCKKDLSSTGYTSTTSAIQAAVAQTNAIAPTVSTTTPGDSIYAVNACAAHSRKDSIAFTALPSSIINYLSLNYAGYAPVKALAVKDLSGTLTGYVAVITFNGNPVAISFDASGNFVRVLEQREGLDLLGHGFHDGGCFEHRDGKQRDTLALSALPAAITSYFSSNYGSDTLVRASITHDSSYVVLSKNGKLYATFFNANGTFISRIELPAHEGKGVAIDQSALPATVLNYLNTTFPGYVFNKAFSISENGTLQGYCVVIDVNNTKYGVQFDTSGNFVRSKTLR